MELDTNKYIHLVNGKGEKKVIPACDFNNEPDDNGGYHIDIEWYLANGYIRLEDAIKEIEGRNSHNVIL